MANFNSGSAWLSKFDSLARWAAVFLIASALLSRALFNLSAFFLIIGIIFSGRYSDRLRVIKRNDLTLPILFLIFLIIFGASYSPASFDKIIDHWERYSKLILVLLVISLFDDLVWMRRAWVGFTIAALLTLISTYANVWWDLPWSKTQGDGWGVDHSVFANYIAQGLTMTFFAAFAILNALHAKKTWLKVLWTVIGLLAAISVTHLSLGRTGMAALLIVTALIVMYELPPKWRRIGVASSVVVIVIILTTSSAARTRFDAVLQEIYAYQQTLDYYTSIGARLHMWRVSLDLWWQSPLWGHGTGSYHDLVNAAFSDKLMCEIGCFHPHNQWLFFAVEHGLIGVLALAFLLGRLLYLGCSSRYKQSGLVVAYFGVFFVDSMVHGPLWIHMEAYFFFSMLALLSAQMTYSRNSSDQGFS